MFRKYSCDCIGFEVTDHDTGELHAYCVEACDYNVGGSNHELGLWLRPELLQKSSEPLSWAHSTELMDKLSMLLFDGYRLREVKSALS